jgi:hypothetical protein
MHREELPHILLLAYVEEPTSGTPSETSNEAKDS